MPSVQDNAQSYEETRYSLGNMTLRELRISMNLSRGLENDPILQGLNGNSQKPLRQYLEETLYRETYQRR